MLRCKLLPEGEGVALTGALDSTTVLQLEKILVAYNNGTIKLDLTGLTELRESGIRPILLASRRLKKAGGDLILVGATQNVREFLYREGYNLVLTIS